MKQDVYEIVTDRIVAMLEKGTVPWRKTWAGGWPRNAVSGREYHGINVLLLAGQGYGDCRWLTFKQALAAGGSVRRGQHGTPIVFWNFREVEESKDGGKVRKTIPFLRYFTVFNVEQCDGLALPAAPEDAPRDNTPIEACEAIVHEWPDPALIMTGDGMAYYRPSDDTIHVPALAAFETAEAFYATLFHEMVHATGHAKRLDRLTEGARFGSGAYSREELVAEMGALFLGARAGIDSPQVTENSAAYCASWVKALKADPRAVVVAAGAAQKAVASIAPEVVEEQTEEASA